MGAEVIKEFLVSLGYKVEAGQERKFKDSVGSATKAVVELGIAAAATATAVTAAVVKIGRSFDNLYWQAQRTQTTVAQIKAMSYAASQLGGSADEASASIEAFGKNLKWNVGFEGFLKQIGVVTRSNGELRNSVALLRDFANVLKGKSKTEQMGLAQVAGIDLRTLEAIQRGDFQRHLDEYAAKVRALGVDEDKASEKGRALQSSLRSLEATLAAVGALLLDKFGPALAGSFDKIEEFLRNNGDKFIAAMEKLAKVAGELAEIFGKIVDALAPIWEGFDKLTQSLTGYDGLTVALTALIALKVAPWLTGIAAAILSVGTAANTALLGGALAKFFGVLGVAGLSAGALALSTSPANGGEDAEIARRRANGTWGKTMTDGTPGAPPQITDKRNWWQRTMPKILGGQDAPSKPASTAPITGSSFGQKAPGVMRRLMEDYGFTKEQAAGIVGNLGHESSGFTEMQEKNPVVPGSRGGYGWAQWTGPRRRAFEAWAAEKGLDPSSDEANYGFLKRELDTTHKNVVGAVKGAGSSAEAMQIFEDGYEKSGVKNYGSRQRWTDRALKAFDAASSQEAGAAAATPQQGRSGFKIDNNLGASDKGNLAKESLLYNGQGIAGQSLDPRLTKTDKPGASLFDPSSPLIRAADNAASIGGAGLGGNGQALTPPPSSSAGTTVSINQENHVNVTGSGDPHDTAQRIGQTQKDTNAGMVRDLKGAVR